jgi:hypothetical protein
VFRTCGQKGAILMGDFAVWIGGVDDWQREVIEVIWYSIWIGFRQTFSEKVLGGFSIDNGLSRSSVICLC